MTQTQSPAAAQPRKTFLKDYLPPAYLFEKIDLEFDIGDKNTQVRAVSRIKTNRKDVNEMRLDGRTLELVKIAINGTTVDATTDADGLTVALDKVFPAGIPAGFDLEIITRITPSENKAYEGLYETKGIFCTQCEAQGFRRITYYVDRPDNMAMFSTTIRADKKKFPHLLSNGNLIASKDLADGRHEAKWEDPFKKPCYLFALVAGDLEFIEDAFTTRSGRKVTLRIFANKGLTHRCHHAMESIKKSMKWDEERFGREYDLDLFMIAAVEDFNAGAMENKGLNIFNAKYVLSNPETATDNANHGIEAVVGHEYFHNWSGDRVTCRDWFQLSLKEGFTVFRDQEFSSDVFSRNSQRIRDVEVLRNGQFSEDAGPNAHPVRPESYIAIDNFYTSTIYNKGAEVIRMMETLLGRDGFRKGCDLYFDTNDGKAVTCDDFVAAMEKANNADLSQFKRWYSQAGTPQIDVSGQYDAAAKSYTLQFKQSCRPTPGQIKKEPFVVPVKLGLIAKSSGKALGFEVPAKNPSLARPKDVVALTQSEETVVLTGVQEEPLPSLFRDFSAPVNYNFAYSDSDFMSLMKFDENTFNRWEATQKIFVKEILKAVKDLKAGKAAQFAPDLTEAFRLHLERAESDRLVTTNLLSLPSLPYLKQFAKPVDPDLLVAATVQLAKTLAKSNEALLVKLYEQNVVSGSYNYNPQDAGRRSLRNLCLYYLCVLGSKLDGTPADTRHFDLAKKQYFSADNLTVQDGAISALRDYDCNERREIMDDFFTRWNKDGVVINLWHRHMAVSLRDSALEEIAQVYASSEFDRNNPNNLYSTVGAFGFGNEKHFHRADGRGYDFVAEKLLEIDSKNAMVAARLSTCFDIWRDYRDDRAQLMRKTIDRMLAKKGLSKNTFEILSNAIANN